MMITAKKIQIEDELEDEDSINEQESKERIEKIKKRNFTVGLGIGLLYSGSRGGLLGAMFLGDNKEFIVGFSAEILELPRESYADSQYVTGSNFPIGYAKENIFVIGTSGAVGTWAKNSGKNGIVSGSTATIGYANIGGFKGLTLSLNYILDTEKDDEDFEGDDLKNTFEFSIGFNI